MATEELIETTVFCTYNQVDHSFIASLEQSGLVEFTMVGEQRFIPYSQLAQVEKMVRMHRELEINVAGIEAIVNMLQRMQQLHQENTKLKNKLRLYTLDN